MIRLCGRVMSPPKFLCVIRVCTGTSTPEIQGQRKGYENKKKKLFHVETRNLLPTIIPAGIQTACLQVNVRASERLSGPHRHLYLSPRDTRPQLFLTVWLFHLRRGVDARA